MPAEDRIVGLKVVEKSGHRCVWGFICHSGALKGNVVLGILSDTFCYDLGGMPVVLIPEKLLLLRWPVSLFRR